MGIIGKLEVIGVGPGHADFRERFPSTRSDEQGLLVRLLVARNRSGAQPQGDVGGLHGPVNYAYQIVA